MYALQRVRRARVGFPQLRADHLAQRRPVPQRLRGLRRSQQRLLRKSGSDR